MKVRWKALASALILLAVGGLLLSLWLFLQWPAPERPVEPLPLANAPGGSLASPIAELSPVSTPTLAVPTGTPTQEPSSTPSPTPTPTAVLPTLTPTAVPPKALPTIEVEQPTPEEAPVLEPAPPPAPAVPPRGVYPSPGVGSPEAVAMEEKTLGYLNWARGRQGILPYRLNPEMQALAREHALLYVETRESTGQYPPADKIGAATKAKGWFFQDGGGPAPFEWMPYSFEEIAANPDRNMAYVPYYRNPKGTEIGIAFAFYSGKGRFGDAGRTVRVVIWNGEWDR